MPEAESPIIERNRPQGEEHPLASPAVMTEVTETMGPKQEMVRLREQAQRRHLTAEGQANRLFKHEDPEGYVEQRLRVSRAKHPERAEENQRRADRHFLSNLYKQSLVKAS